MEGFDTPPATEAAQQSFFDSMLASTQRAQATQPAITRHIHLAGILLRLNFTGPALHDAFFPALAHLECAAAPPDATLNIWDSVSTRINIPAPPCARNQFTDRGDIFGFESHIILSAFHWLECSIALYNTQTNTGIFWVDDPAALPYWSQASPLRTLLHWVTSQHGAHLLHAAVIGTSAGGIIITGKGGIGKSTTALLCLEAGMNYIGDDYVIIKLTPAPCAYRLYGTAKLNPDNAARFPRLAASQIIYRKTAAHGIPEKSVFQLHPAWAAQMPESLPLIAIAMPQITNQDHTDFTTIDTNTIRRAAAFTTLSHLPRAGRATQDFIGQLCNALPRFTLRLGRDLPKIPAAISNFLEHPPAPTPAAATAITNPPPISIIIPAHNGAKFLPEAIASILAQNHPALDIIIVDDASTDDIPAAIATLPVDVRYFRLDHNAGPAGARNRGIRESSGDLLAFLDIDDLWPEGNLACLLAALNENPQAGIAIGHGQLFRGSNGAMNFFGNAAECFPYAISAALYRRSAFAKIGLFDPSLRYGEDTDWFKRAEEQNLGIVRLDETTLLVRRHETNMTSGKSLVELNALKVFKKILDRQRAQP